MARVIAANQQMDEVHDIYERFAPKPTQLELGDNRRISELERAKLAHELQEEGVRAELATGDTSAYRIYEME